MAFHEEARDGETHCCDNKDDVDDVERRLDARIEETHCWIVMRFRDLQDRDTGNRWFGASVAGKVDSMLIGDAVPGWDIILFDCGRRRSYIMIAGQPAERQSNRVPHLEDSAIR